MAENHLVDILGLYPGIGQRIASDAHDHALDRLPVELPERQMRPTYDAGSHGGLRRCLEPVGISGVTQALPSDGSIRCRTCVDAWTLNTYSCWAMHGNGCQ